MATNEANYKVRFAPGNTAEGINEILDAMADGETGFYRISYTPDPAANRAKFTAAVETPALILTDTATGKRYRVTVANGQLALTQED